MALYQTQQQPKEKVESIDKEKIQQEISNLSPDMQEMLKNYTDTNDPALLKVANSMQNKLKRFDEQGYPMPKETKEEAKVGILNRVFSALRVLDPGPLVRSAQKGQSVLGTLGRQFKRAWTETVRGKEYEADTQLEEEIDQSTMSDVLDDWGWKATSTPSKFARAAVGLGLDIVGDPKTWLTLGTGKAAKVFVPKKGTVALTNKGDDMLKKLVSEYGTEAGNKAMANVVNETGEKYIKKSGLNLFGKQVVEKPFKKMDEFMNRIPAFGQAYKAVKAWGKKGLQAVAAPFDRYSDIRKKMPKDMYEKFKRIEKGTVRKSKKALSDDINEIRLWYKNVIDETDAEKAFKLGQKIERGQKVTGDSLLDNFIKWATRRNVKYRKGINRGLKAFGVDEMGKVDDYVGHFITKKGRKFLEKQPGNYQSFVDAMAGFSRSKPGMLKGRKVLGHIDEINDRMRPLMKKAGIKMGKHDGFFEPNIFKALAKQSQKYHQTVKAFNYYDEMFERFGLNVEDLTKIQKGQLDDMLEATGKKQFTHRGVTYIKPDMKMFGKKMGKDTFMPAPIVEDFKKTRGVIVGDDMKEVNNFLKFYDKSLNFFKKNVTGYFPAFHTRNFMGASFNNFLAGVRKPVRYAQAAKLAKYRKAIRRGEDVADEVLDLGNGIKMKMSKIVNMADKQNIFQQPGIIDVMRNVDDEIAAMEKTAGGLKKRIWQIKDAPLKGFEVVENHVRMPLFLNRLARGESAEQAAKAVYKYHFDYAPEALSSFEKNVVKRIIPFYTWTRHNIPLQFEQLIKKPGIYAATDKLKREIDAVSGTDKVQTERENMPNWMKEMFTIRLPHVKSTGEPYYLQMDLPLEDLNKLSIREIAGMMSPLLKYPAETMMNKNFYFNSPVYNEDLPREYQLSRTMEIFKKFPQPIKDFLNIQEVETKDYYTGKYEKQVMMDSRKLNFLRSLWFSRFYSTAANAADDDANWAEKISRLASGWYIRPLDIPRQQWRSAKEKDAMLRSLLYHTLRTKRMPYAGEEEGFQRGTPVPKDTIARDLGEMLPF